MIMYTYISTCLHNQSKGEMGTIIRTAPVNGRRGGGSLNKTGQSGLRID